MCSGLPGKRLIMDDGQGPGSRSLDEAAIRALEAAYDRAWNAADLGGLTAPFTPDASIVDPFGGVSSGRAEIERLLTTLFDGAGRGSTHTSTVLSVRFVTDDVALVDGEAVIEGLGESGGGVMPTLVHRFTDVLVKHDGSWRIAQVRAYVFVDGPRP
jgi:uncharacterized protein (TIGR02246 family)